jgi:hypothetical protein
MVLENPEKVIFKDAKELKQESVERKADAKRSIKEREKAYEVSLFLNEINEKLVNGSFTKLTNGEISIVHGHWLQKLSRDEFKERVQMSLGKEKMWDVANITFKNQSCKNFLQSLALSVVPPVGTAMGISMMMNFVQVTVVFRPRYPATF